jgi:hypothetical protein
VVSGVWGQHQGDETYIGRYKGCDDEEGKGGEDGGRKKERRVDCS